MWPRGIQSLSSVQERSVSPGNLSKEVAAKTKWVMGATNNTKDTLMVRGSSCYNFPFVRLSPLIQLNLITNCLFSFIFPLKYHSRPLKKLN